MENVEVGKIATGCEQFMVVLKSCYVVFDLSIEIHITGLAESLLRGS